MNPPHTVPLSGWGRYPVVEGVEVVGEDLELITRDVSLTRGLGRSYGDASLPSAPGRTVACTRLADRILSFDPETGVLRAEAGLSLHALNRALLHRGWFTPVTPGTQFVTLGGMVAADVHGKNHHAAGTFGRHVSGLTIRTADGEVREITEDSHPDLFLATLGGMGLTGHVLEVEFRLERVRSPWIWAETETVPDVDALVEKLVEAGKTWPFTVSWADCLASGRSLGRGMVIKGRWAEPGEAPEEAPAWGGAVDVPVVFPDFALNGLSMRGFNFAYYNRPRVSRQRGVVHPAPFYYPLDALTNWNRIYGKRGFTQYQCVVPYDAGTAGCRRLIEIMAERGALPFLCVVKDFGAEGRGMLSFPRPGITLAVDIPIRGTETQALVDALNEYVLSVGGRVYLAKDAFTRPEHFRAMEPRLPAFDEVRRRWDPERRIRSAQSVRLLGDQPL